MDRHELTKFAENWIAGWNAQDLDAILAHYADDVVFHSPMIARVTGEDRSSVTGLAALGAYWRQALALAPDLRFELRTVLLGRGALTILYTNQTGRQAAETFVFTPEGKVSLSIATYALS
ncbi:nuclear transport factor 2 family protein [Caulobacter sp. NIBR1757]|uniref:nuclear transport factor 2 family protein n=1 Tax=Caulobacter sp. NIBR1757 TaxID=3016000 RepID=UPI0022F06EAB|nr:nuclear transport factor 2 family protein [Caulobacter sp. NIBR1757]WGM37742.1 hypothetical protein AMEJIAPC_00642 [Caulobacter sp. NIBR1757]